MPERLAPLATACMMAGLATPASLWAAVLPVARPPPASPQVVTATEDDDLDEPIQGFVGVNQPLADSFVQLERWRAAGARFIAQGYFDRAWRYQAADRLEAALADFERGLARDPTRHDAALARARLLGRLERHDDAIAAFETLIDGPAAHLGALEAAALKAELLGLLLATERWLPALLWLERFDPGQPSRSELLQTRVGLVARLGDREGLLAAWLDVADDRQASAEQRRHALDQAAAMAAELGEHRSSLQLLDRLSHEFDAVSIDRRRALTLEHLLEPRAAIAAWQRVLARESDPTARLAVIDSMLGHARALADRTLESSLLRAAYQASGGQVSRLRDLVGWMSVFGEPGEAAELALELATRTATKDDRALAYDLLVIHQGSRPGSNPSWVRLEQLALAQADQPLLARIAAQHLAARRDDAALALLEPLARSAPAALRREVLLQLVDLRGRRGDSLASARALLEADALPGGGTLSLADKALALATLGETEQALALLDSAPQAASVEAALLRGMLDRLGPTADRAVRHGLYQRLAEAQGLSAEQRAQAHLEAAELARQMGAAMSIAESHYRAALALAPRRRVIHQSLAELLTAQARHAEAAQAWAQLDRLADEPQAGLRALVSYAQDRQWSSIEPLAVLVAPRLDRLSTQERFDFWTVRGEAHVQHGQTKFAIAAWERALELRADPALQARLSRLFAQAARERIRQANEQGRLDVELSAWRELREFEPGAEAERGLGYALLRAQDPAGAAQALARAERLGGPQPGLLADLGYAWLRAGERAQAQAAFGRAIDQLLDGGEPSQVGPPSERLNELKALRETLLESARRWRVAAWQNWREHDDRMSRLKPSLGAGTVGAINTGPRAGGGVDVAYRPPASTGAGDGPLEGFARLHWALRAPSGGGIDEDSLQAGLGLRYTLATLPGVTAAFERQLAIGEQARNDWLLRASWGRSWRRPIEGSDRIAWRGQWFGDAGYYTAARTRLVFGEWIQGVEIPLAADRRLLPHLVLHGRGLAPDRYREAWLEAGLGVSIEARTGGDRYIAPRSHWVGTLRYKFRIDGAGREGWELLFGYRW